MNNLRYLMLCALLLDWFGQVSIFILISLQPTLTGSQPTLEIFQAQVPWLLFVLLLYPFLGWLFGSYTVLRWQSLSCSVLSQRLLSTAAATLIVVSSARALIEPSEVVWLVHPLVLFSWFGALSLWVSLVRIGLRRGLLMPNATQIFLLVQPWEMDLVLSDWRRVPQRQSLRPVESSDLVQLLDQAEDPIHLSVSQSVRADGSLRSLLASLEMRDPRQLRITSVLSVFEQHQERLPPALMVDTVLTYDDLPWATPFSVQAQLKRSADLFVAAILLLLTSPFVLLAILFIWIEDRGPVFYAQKRSGWLGRPFTVYKLRTMTVQPADAPVSWTEPGDRRITMVGIWLRRFRLDELPQLFNVLNGDMSLIGPRPERPELESSLEKSIFHYRKRHWMRPGLSGWAQVCAPYASSISDSDLKLSYDLYYLLHFSTWLDLLILFRTVKTVLKAGGR